MEKLLLIAAGGAAGAVSRFLVASMFARIAPGFPWGVLVVNVVGAFLFGALWSASSDREWISQTMRDAVFIGFLGAMTTFSTFAFNNLQLASAGAWKALAANILLNNVAAIAAVWLGVRWGRTLAG